MPLYWAGLWEAVMIAPGDAELPCGEVQEIGRDQPEERDRGALAACAVAEGGRELFA